MKTLGAILTTIDPAFPAQPQKEVINSWLPSAAVVFTLTQEQNLPPAYGRACIQKKKGLPSLREVVTTHMGRVRGRELIGIGLPTFKINQSFVDLEKKIDALRLGTTWAFHFKTKPEDKYPSFFVLNTMILPRIAFDIPANVTFSGVDWAAWLHQFLSYVMNKNFYLDGASLNQIAPVDVPKPVVVEPVVNAYDFSPEPELEKIVKKVFKKRKKLLKKMAE